nr:M50 family metallopeptidase [uncultured Holophaga sp.]
MKRFPALACSLPFLGLALAIPGVGVIGPIVLICGLIFIHELGHFLAAKRMGMPVETFSLGFGPRLVGFKWAETDVRLSLLPLGGYVKLSGYNPEDPDAEDPHGFLKQPAGKRFLFYAGGIIANILGTVVLLYCVGMSQIRITEMKALPSPLQVEEVIKGAPAEQGGLRAGDQIQALGPLRFPGATSQEAITLIQGHGGQPIPVQVDREGRTLSLNLTPRGEPGAAKLGIQFTPSAFSTVRRPFQALDPLRTVPLAFSESARMGGMILQSLGRLVSGKASVKEVGGPIAIIKAGSRAAKSGWESFFMMSAFISMNLAIFNALPIPFLDGGHMLILIIERLRRKDLSVTLKERILTVGFFLLAGLMALVIGLDLWRLKH